MGTPYANLEIITGHKNPNFSVPGKSPKQSAKFLMQKDRMQGKYLGACLDSIRWANMTTITYDMTMNEFLLFVQNWFEQNEKNYEKLFHEVDLHKIWEKFELPYIENKSCPTCNDHIQKVELNNGTVLCAEKQITVLRPSYIKAMKFWDKNAKMEKIHHMNIYPHAMPCEDPSEDYEYDEEDAKLEQMYEDFEKEEKSVFKENFCYAIIKENKNNPMSLERIFRRLNIRDDMTMNYCQTEYFPDDVFTDRGYCQRGNELSKEQRKHTLLQEGQCQGHWDVNNMVSFHEDGWTLAHYVQKWYEQKGNKTFFDAKPEINRFPEPFWK